MVDVLEKIVAQRRARIAQVGAAQGLALPDRRERPIQPFPGPVVAEIKRRSPSRGNIATVDDPCALAAVYRQHGARSLSILTEQDHFSGALADLVSVADRFPDMAVLRKDFLLTEEDIDLSWRAGADAVLLIAAVLDPPTLRRLHERALARGMAALVEVHTQRELDAVRPLAPQLLGINSRDLRTFRLDLLTPVQLAAEVDWPCTLVFESGVFWSEHARLARDAGFDAVLVGEAVARNPERIEELNAALRASATAAPFWAQVARRRKTDRPLVKVCGITNLEDALAAQTAGADLLGMIYAESPRRAPRGLAAQLAEHSELPRVAVVVESGERSDPAGLEQAQRDLADGLVSALQLHGTTPPADAGSLGWPYYQVLRPSTHSDIDTHVTTTRGIRTLVDTYKRGQAGGTGTMVPDELVTAYREGLRQRPHGALWLAGGLNPDNVAERIGRHHPELLDVSSGIEARPGRKDPVAIERFFAAVATAATATASDYASMEVER